MLNFDSSKYNYPSRRNLVYAKNALAATSVPAGAEIGLDVMRHGGNAIDAAVAMAASMPILEPTSNGLGSDCFALIWIEKDKKLYGLNASGFSPKNISAEKVRELGYTEMPKSGWIPTMVPGCVSGWQKMIQRFGTKSFDELFSYAIDYAENGCPVYVNVSKIWKAEINRIIKDSEKNPKAFEYWKKVFLTEDGSYYKPGDVFKWSEYGQTLRELAQTDCESFYRGKLMEKTIAFSKATGGFYEESDFTSYNAEWVTPITTDYKGYTVCEIPPNGHGITVLMALNILEGLTLPKDRETDEYYHKIMESIKLAYADAKEYVADPRFMKTTSEKMLSKEYAAKRRALITEKALMPETGDPNCGGTIYLCTADKEGNMVSFIQSNYNGFGSGIAVPDTGLSFQNRGANFYLDETKANYLEGHKKSYHTIIPGFLMQNGLPLGPFGVMGAFMQPQGQLEVLSNMIDYNMNPQDALDAPRIQWTKEKNLQIEFEASDDITKGLIKRGHNVEVITDTMRMGRGQIILKMPNGVYCGATEKRCDGTVAGF